MNAFKLAQLSHDNKLPCDDAEIRRDALDSFLDLNEKYLKEAFLTCGDFWYFVAESNPQLNDDEFETLCDMDFTGCKTDEIYDFVKSFCDANLFDEYYFGYCEYKAEEYLCSIQDDL